MTTSRPRTAVNPTREEDFPEWYQQVLKAADLADNSPVRGCMVIKPWGFGIWERIQRQLDDRIKQSGHQNAYFPLFIPLSFLEKEAQHVEGFAKECAVVTHHRLEMREGKLVPAGELEEPLIVRPTSETIIGHSFAKWIESYRDLPLLINQWANVVRWEMRPRIFLRTTEFLWQEGHTVHATHEDAMNETLSILEMYRCFVENVLALPVIPGEKSPGERFPGAVATYTLEMMMQDRKALQGCTSHYLGQNFAKAQNIQFTNEQGQLQHGFTTSWGLTTRLIGGLIMVHGDDDGLRLPPRVAPQQVVILPVIPKAEAAAEVLAAAETLRQQLCKVQYHQHPLGVITDKRDLRGGDKNWEWIKKGIPVRLELGPRDLQNASVTLYRRDKPHKEGEQIRFENLNERLVIILEEIQHNYYTQAKAFQQKNIHDNIHTLDELKAFFTPKNAEKPEAHGGFILAKWCEDPTTESLLEELKVTIRCLPVDQRGTEGKCIFTGRPATRDIILAKSY